MKIGIAGPVEINSLKQHLHLDKDSYLELGLGGTSVNNLVNSLLNRGFHVSVYTLDSKVSERLILSGEKLKVYFGHYRTSHRQRGLDFFRKESHQIRRFIEEDKPDIVHAHWSYEFAIGALKSKLPHVITFRDSAWDILKLHRDSFRVIRYMMDYWVKRNGQNFTVNSIYLQKKLSSFKKNITIVPNSINEQFIGNKKKYPSNKILIISILNGWTERKNPQKALLAFKMLREQYGEKVEYHLYGPGYGVQRNSKGWAKENECLDGVRFCGEMSHVEMMGKIRDYDILLHPALEESFGNTLLEGLANGLPIIGGKEAGAVPWVLNEGENGLLVDVTSSEEMYKALKRLMDDVILFEKLSSEGIDYIIQNFTNDKILDKYLEIYHQIIKNKT